ncbi:hypothetical protein C1I95_10555 [Micromonospora craterilacus]|uniref:DUF2306 domain-containing protein n=1 Tax=Micromonospora craterilacus TaxID=1655439 RepID=A0A2W2F2D6_9ACTN|nr:DUF2306 domain-containing protein [Micromonospora craterilacus]PZG19970.1 hypothetical protein C1I95_10555 [Micromonospora craterilacus]
MSQSTAAPPTGGRVPPPPARRRWWRRPWIFPLMFVAVAFIAFSVPPYLTFDPDNSRIPPPDALGGLYFPLLVVHVFFASIAMVTACFQIWPWFRRRNPQAHRIMGRVYVLGGVLPAGLAGLAIGAVTPFGPVNLVSNMVMAPLWLTFTLVGFRMARRRRFVEHRRWMIRSFALTFSIITNRVWAVFAVIILSPQLDTTFGGSDIALQQAISAISAWLGWVGTLLIAEWWLERTRRRGARPAEVPRG